MSPETYWKRRVFVLAGLLLVVALSAYACNLADGTEQAANDDTDSSPESSPSPSVPPSPSPTADASPDDDEEEDQEEDEDAAAEDEGTGGGGSGSGGSGGAGGSGGGGAAAAQEEPADPCRPQDVVVTMKTDEEDYAWDDKPEIELTVVNTGDRACTVDTGPKSMEVRITSGDDRVFSTADCVKGSGADNERLSRGVPHTTTVTWDRKRSWKDCRDRDANASSGTYVASLHGDYSEGAEKQVFRLN